MDYSKIVHRIMCTSYLNEVADCVGYQGSIEYNLFLITRVRVPR